MSNAGLPVAQRITAAGSFVQGLLDGPLRLMVVPYSSLPAAASYKNCVIFVEEPTDVVTQWYSDGTAWYPTAEIPIYLDSPNVSHTGNTTATIQSNTYLVRVDSQSAINYLTTYADGGGAQSMQYALHIRVEAIPEPA